MPRLPAVLAPCPRYEDAQDWCDVAEHWTVHHYVNGSTSLREFPMQRESHSYCSSCDSFDTLTTQLLSYGNLTTCTTDGCDFESYYSIGD